MGTLVLAVCDLSDDVWLSTNATFKQLQLTKLATEQPLPEQSVWHALTAASITVKILPPPTLILQLSWVRRQCGSVL
jgi:hypothetical protein